MQNNLKYTIPAALIFLSLGAALFLRFKSDSDEEIAPTDEEEERTPRETADAEKRRIMSELGKKGAAKSAEVRRAKKKAKEEAVQNDDDTVSP